MNKIINRLQNEFNKSPDLVIKSITINIFKKIYIAYLETVSSSNKVNDYILKNLILKKDNITKGNIASFIAAPNTLEIKNTDKCEFYLTNGFSLVIIDNKILAIETRADINRAVSDSQVESSINGPKDAFTENIQINIGLIKRRIKSSTLKTENRTIGRKTLTNISVLYFEDIADKKLVDNILEKIDKQIIKNVRERSIDIQKYEGGEDDMKNEKRKQAIYEYKEKKTTGGVYKITNTESKKSLIKGEVDLQSMQNRFNFSVSVNSCLNIKLQKDWNKYGAKSFTFEILEETEMKPEMDRREFKKYLNEMAEKYTENMDPEELY